MYMIFCSPASQITHFTPTSSKALDELLNTIRHKIILPSYLPLAQRKIIHSPKYEKKLQSDPIIIEIDGEVLKFRHTNPLKGGIPQTRRSVIRAVEQFAAPEDFANLKPLLEGIHYTNYKFDASFHTKILRVCGVRGRIYHVLQCARAARTTGLRLDSSEKANEALHFVQLKAVDAGFDPTETARALRWAEIVVAMLADEQHRPHRRPVEGELPLDRDPQVLLARLHLAASLAQNPFTPQPEEGVSNNLTIEEVVGKVNDYAADIVRLWPEGRRLREIQPLQLYQDENKMGYLSEPNKFVALAAPLLHGLDAAIDVVGGVGDKPQLADQLRARRDTLNAEIQEARAGLSGEETPRRGEAIYQKLYGQQQEA